VTKIPSKIISIADLGKASANSIKISPPSSAKNTPNSTLMSSSKFLMPHKVK